MRVDDARVRQRCGRLCGAGWGGGAKSGLWRHPWRLRAAGYRVEYPLKPLAFGKQFKAALESGAKLALIYGSDELARDVVKLRDLGGRTERDVPRDQVLAAVRGFLAGP